MLHDDMENLLVALTRAVDYLLAKEIVLPDDTASKFLIELREAVKQAQENKV